MGLGSYSIEKEFRLRGKKMYNMFQNLFNSWEAIGGEGCGTVVVIIVAVVLIQKFSNKDDKW